MALTAEAPLRACFDIEPCVIELPSSNVARIALSRTCGTVVESGASERARDQLREVCDRDNQPRPRYAMLRSRCRLSTTLAPPLTEAGPASSMAHRLHVAYTRDAEFVHTGAISNWTDPRTEECERKVDSERVRLTIGSATQGGSRRTSRARAAMPRSYRKVCPPGYEPTFISITKDQLDELQRRCTAYRQLHSLSERGHNSSGWFQISCTVTIDADGYFKIISLGTVSELGNPTPTHRPATAYGLRHDRVWIQGRPYCSLQSEEDYADRSPRARPILRARKRDQM